MDMGTEAALEFLIELVDDAKGRFRRDGLIFINTEEELISGDFAKVKITGALEYDLIGELL